MCMTWTSLVKGIDLLLPYHRMAKVCWGPCWVYSDALVMKIQSKTHNYLSTNIFIKEKSGKKSKQTFDQV